MSDRFYTSITAIVLVICGATGFVNADERAPQGVADRIEKPLRIAPRPGNDRNSEGDFIQLHDGRLMLVYTKFVGKSDHATAELVARYSTDQGKTWTSDDVAIVAASIEQIGLHYYFAKCFWQNSNWSSNQVLPSSTVGSLLRPPPYATHGMPSSRALSRNMIAAQGG